MSRADYEITAEDLHRKMGEPSPPLILDVRRYDELSICHLPGALHVPMDELQDRLDELDPEKETVVICHHGVRSLSVTAFLRNHGFREVSSLAGGIDRWSLVVDPSVPRY
jgi:rhodanese-related sulfurtransferase